MADHRPFPPSARRRALARRAGLHAASPLIVGAAAGAAALAAAAALGGSLVDRLGAALAAASTGRAPDAAPRAVLGAVLDALAAGLPIAGAAAFAALVAHVVQTGAVWLPRRRIAEAPALEAGPAPRTGRAVLDLAAAAAIGGVALAALWFGAPQLATLFTLDPVVPEDASVMLRGGAGLLANLVIALVVAWGVLGVLDALVRHAALGRALAMTTSEKRDDDRHSGVDPRWRAHRAATRDANPAAAIAGSSLLLLGEGAAVAVAWDPLRRPIPVRTATGRGLRARQLLGLARRHRIPIHRDPALTASLVASDGPIPARYWPQLAEVIAAARGRDRAV